MELDSGPACLTTTLGSLSDELILLILGTFCPHCREGPHELQHAYFVATGKHRYEPSWYAEDVSTLCSMSLVSRTFSRLAQDVLYHEFAPGQGYSLVDDWYSIEYNWYWCLEPFLRTVALNPDRAALVKRVHVNPRILRSLVDDSFESEILQDAAQARGLDVSNLVASFGDLDPQVDPYHEGPEVGDVLLGMLLACLPHLKSLTFASEAPLRAIPASALRAAGLSALRIQTLGIVWCDGTVGRTLGGLLELGCATIRNLQLNHCDGEGLRVLARHGPFPTLRGLCIANSRACGSDVASFLSCHAGLEACCYHSGLVTDDFMLSDAFTHLLGSTETLRTLYLDVSPDPQGSAGDKRRLAERLASLSSFPVLRHLLLSSALLDSSISAGESAEDGGGLTRLLPPSIVSLQIVAPEDMETGVRLRLGTALLRLAEAVSQGQFPNLKSVSCYRQDFDGAGLAAMFSGARVDFAYDPWHFQDGVTGRSPAYSTASAGSDEEDV